MYVFLIFLGLRWTVNTHCECVFLRSLLDGLLACRLLAPKEWFRLKNTHCKWVFFIKKTEMAIFTNHHPPS
jgi:hypothetical protein